MGKGKSIKESAYDEADYKKMEKNHRAIKIIVSGLSSGDKAKVLLHKTIKEKWDALSKIHQGNLDDKRDRILALLQDWDNLAMGEKEEIEDFHSRFLTLVNALKFLEEEIEDWKQVVNALQCLNSTWDPITNAFHAQGGMKNLDNDYLFGKLSAHGGWDTEEESSTKRAQRQELGS